MVFENKGKILLSGFDLDPFEKASITSLIENHADKINEKIKFKEIKLRLKKSLKGKTFLHEVQGTLITDKQFTADVTGYNLFSVIDEVFNKLMKEAEHRIRKK